MTSNDNRTKTVFVSNIADVSIAHLLELMIALGAYRDGLVLVGGWVPYLLLREYQNPTANFQHVGSVDIDIAVNPNVVNKERYSSLIALIQQRGYTLKDGSRFSFVKTVQTTRGEEQIQIDFLGPEYGGSTRSHRHQTVQDEFFLRKARGADIVFDQAIPLTLEGKLPNGGEGKTTIQLANIVGAVTMKGIVMGSRYKEKDAYDLASLVLYYKDGPISVADEVRPYMENGLVKESLDFIREKFRSREAEGPTWFADFQESIGEAREQFKTQAYLEVQRFLLALYEPKKFVNEPKTDDLIEQIPVLDIEPGIGGRGGSKGHFVHFQAINIGDKIAIDCQWGIRGFAYEWRSSDLFTLRPGATKNLEYQIDGTKPFNEFIPELNIFFEFKDNKGRTYFSRRELKLVTVPSGAFNNITGVGQFFPAVKLTDSGIVSISDPMTNGDRDESIVSVKTATGTKKIKIGISRTMSSIWDLDNDGKIKAAIAELAMRKIKKMIAENKITDYMFSSFDVPKDQQGGFEAYKIFRDSLDH